MMKNIILSIFKRKGGEGLFTKVGNSAMPAPPVLLPINEDELIRYYEHENKWLIVSDQSLMANDDGTLVKLRHENIKQVVPDMSAEYAKGVHKTSDFTKLQIMDIKGTFYSVSMEAGKPYNGLLQLLSYISSNSTRAGKCGF
jgi:hypothetical protein